MLLDHDGLSGSGSVSGNIEVHLAMNGSHAFRGVSISGIGLWLAGGLVSLIAQVFTP
jgi:hypothetical protein